MPFMAALPAIMGGASLLGKLFGGAAKGSADQRMAENNQTGQQNDLAARLYGTRQGALLQALMAKDRGAMDRYSTRQGATTTALGQEEAGKLNRAQLGLQAPTIRAKQSLLGSAMENMQPVSVSGLPTRLQGRVPTISGGLSPSMLSDTTRAHGKELQRAALAAQFSGSDIPAATDFKSGILDAPEMVDFEGGVLATPEMQKYKQAGKLEKALGIGGLLGSMIGGIGDLMPQAGETMRLNNAMPTPYAGTDMYGNAANFQLPRGQMQPPPIPDTYFGYGG